jgi:ribose transport system substrate-binding protein
MKFNKSIWRGIKISLRFLLFVGLAAPVFAEKKLNSVALTAIGCDLAAKQAERKGFFIVSIDGSPDVVPFLKDPNSLIAATAAQDPYTMAEKAVEIGYNIMNGKKPKQQLTLIPVEFITKENVNQYKGWTK